MNNASIEEISEESRPDTTVEQARLTRLLEAIAGLSENKDWRTLQELHFSQEDERITRLLLGEVDKPDLDPTEIYRLQGERRWAKRYGDFLKFAAFLKKQLEHLKNLNQ